MQIKACIAAPMYVTSS